jgi:hypothetical protein
MAQFQSRPIRESQVAAFRLARHFLGKKKSADLVAVSRAICGVQAQVMGSAELALRARIPKLDRAEIRSALWEERSLAKTSLMRQTIHLIPADEFGIYIAALRKSRLEAVLRIMARFGIGAKDIDWLNEAIVGALQNGPRTQPQLREVICPRANKNLKAWMDKVWSMLRTAVAEGFICYGPSEDQEITFICADRWLPSRQKIDEAEAQRALLRRYLGAYGPATLQDFSHWSGIPMRDAQGVWESILDETAEVAVEGQKLSILRSDHAALAQAEPFDGALHLLPGFDCYLLAHSKKDHIVDDRYYKRVYRNQGWISATVILDGRVIGTWTHSRGSSALKIDVVLFSRQPKAVRREIERKAENLSQFLGSPCKIRYAM